MDSNNKHLTEEEAQRYDRQVRIWGAEAQLRLQTSKVFISGLKGLNCEVIKNIILMGVSVVLHDTSLVIEDDLSYNYFLSRESIGLNLAEAMLLEVQKLNSLAIVSVDIKPLNELINNDYLNSFNVILLSNCSYDNIVRINRIGRLKSPNTVIFISGVFGNDSWFISDFGNEFNYTDDPPNNKQIHSFNSKSIEDILSIQWNQLESKHFPLKDKDSNYNQWFITFIMSRILSYYSDRYGNQIIDKEKLKQTAKELLVSNNINEDIITDNHIEYLYRVSSSVTVIPCSVLGSFLAQEVIKAVSRSGKPHSNIWLFNTESLEVKGLLIN